LQVGRRRALSRIARYTAVWALVVLAFLSSGCSESHHPSGNSTLPTATLGLSPTPPFTPVNRPVLPPPSIYGVHFIDSQRGWAIFAANEDATARAILATTDGGASWHTLSEVPYRVYAIDFANELHGWVATSQYPHPGVLLETNDGGMSWSELINAPNAMRASIELISPSIGYIYGLGHGLAITVDGGRTWTEVASPCDERDERPKLSFAGATTGMVVCLHRNGGAGFQGKRLFTTVDGGAIWTQIPDALGTQEYLIQLFALDNKRAWYATGGPPGANLYGTLDGGQHWEMVDLPGGRGYFFQIRSIQFLDPLKGWVVVSRAGSGPGTILATRDGGVTWTALPAP
jgi:photosystem II stability/assembly factor-like uncharacterized protein